MKYLCQLSIFCKPQSYNDVTKYYTLQITRESLKTAIVQKYSYVDNWTKNLNSAHLHSSKNLIFKASSLFNPVGLAGYFEYSQKRTDIFCYYFCFEIVHRHFQICPPNPVIS